MIFNIMHIHGKKSFVRLSNKYALCLISKQ
ncbi:hypothetical protein C7387_1550 [Yokenella regensburgei]|uniref:Uncharacterized protein n=1 Tax=Yokenella regensburgei TaxID=158877 RepID=A0ABX9S200_9ENTR|nr:hypothetical protein C7387_1550 [Yokenella regensburgei]VFS14378.1 Uncharacterised protein [Yokenella regensburgei]